MPFPHACNLDKSKILSSVKKSTKFNIQAFHSPKFCLRETNPSNSVLLTKKNPRK